MDHKPASDRLSNPENISSYPLLERVNKPADLKQFSPEELIALCNELREFIIDIVSQHPGHVGANLGVVELTVALHSVFNTPEDKIIWDVGHQAYSHKILTGRRDVFHTNRKYGGISGFPKMSESEYDAFGVGHSSTSISAALGIAIGLKNKGLDKQQVVAVIGDGSLTGGMAFEGLNNAGFLNSNLLVILNDNNIAIDPNVGALKEYLVDITTSKTYNKLRNEIWHVLGYISKINPHAREYAQKLEASLKSIFLKQSNLFESLNFRYFGPVDGHDVLHVMDVLRDLKDIPGPKLLHLLTKKGKGFQWAEQNQTVFHSPGKFDRNTGEILKLHSDQPQPLKYQDVFGITLTELAEQNTSIVGITPAMPSGCSMNIMMEKMPERVFDVGIAEQHAVTFSAGLAAQGMIPFCNIYSSFMQRAYDQVIHDVAIQQLPVVFCLDRAGIVGDDGATHHGAFDLAYMRCIPGLTIAAPMDEVELRNLMYSAQLRNEGPWVIRYPRGQGVIPEWKQSFAEIQRGKGRMVREGSELAILTLGNTGNFVSEAMQTLEKEGIQPTHVDMRFLKPLDTELLHKILKNHQKLITIEDGVISGGFGTAILEFISENNYQAQVVRLGIPDRFIEHGSPQELWRECGYDVQSIIETVRRFTTFRKVLQKVG